MLSISRRFQTEYFKKNCFNIFFILYVLSISYNAFTYALFLSISSLILVLFYKLDSILQYAILVITTSLSLISIYSGNPPVGVFLTFLSVIIGLYLAKVFVTSVGLSKNLFYVYLLLSNPLFWSSNWRFSGTFENANTFGCFVCLSYITLFFKRANLHGIIDAIFLLYATYMVFLTASKLWSILILFILVTKINKIIFLSLVPYLFLQLDFVNLFSNLIHRFEIFFDNSDGSRLDRHQVIIEGISIFLDNPFWGTGILGFIELSSFDHHTHSSLLDSLVSFGLIGFFFIITLNILMLFKLFKSYFNSYLSLSSVVIFLFTFVSFLFFDSIYSNVYALFLFFLILSYSTKIHSYPTHD